MKVKYLAVILVLACSLFGGCMAGEAVYSEPPPPQVEVWGAPPEPNLIWIGGYWEWHSRWIWVPGHWSPRPYPHAVWVPHYWVRHYNGWRRVPGHWR